MTKKRKRITAREFSSRFTKIVSRHLSTLPPEEQDRRIRNAERTALNANRAERPTSRTVEETRVTPLLSRSREYGAIGNLVDRLTIGHVTDFISIGKFPVFNIADSSISVGCVVLLLGVWWQERVAKKEKMQQASSDKPSEATSE